MERKTESKKVVMRNIALLTEKQKKSIEILGDCEWHRTLGEPFGQLVQIRLLDSDKTYHGILLGDFTAWFDLCYDKTKKTTIIMPHDNPAIYVPELEKVVWGAGSWWSPITKPEEIKTITNKDIKQFCGMWKRLLKAAEARKGQKK